MCTCNLNQSNLMPRKSNTSPSSTADKEKTLYNLIHNLLPLLWLTSKYRARTHMSYCNNQSPCLTLREVMVLTKEDMMMDSSSGHTDRF